MSKELDDAYFRSTPCTHHEPLLGKLVDCVDMLEERIKGLLGAKVYVGETNTLPAGSEATASASKRGYDTVLDFGIPRGKDGSDAEATDVRINGTSITAGGVADIPLAATSAPGVVGIRTDGQYGLAIGEGNNLFVRNASTSEINSRTNEYKAITTNRLDYAVKAAMTDGKGAAWTADEQASARERMNAADANKVYIMQKQIENLQGIAATEETDSTEAYTKTVPTGAQKWASLDKVGGKTVVWNQLYRRLGDTAPSGGLNAEYKENGHIRIFTDAAGIQSDIMFYFMNLFSDYVLPAGHKYLINAPYGGTGKYRVSVFSSTGARVLDAYEGPEIYSASKPVARLAFTGLAGWVSTAGLDFNPFIIDLTSAFGSSNEPTSLDDPRIAFIKAYAEQHPEYNPGELMSAEVVEVESRGKNLAIVDTFPIPKDVRDMCPGYGWSAGTVCNEIDFERKVYVQRVARVDLGTLTWKTSASVLGGEGFFVADFATGFTFSTSLKNAICSLYQQSSGQSIYNGTVDKAFAINDMYISSSAERIYVRDNTYTDSAAFKAAMAGVLLYYELAEPIEVDLSDVLPDDHYIEVEAGGTVTFKQASTQLPVPSSVTYQISTSEVIANA